METKFTWAEVYPKSTNINITADTNKTTETEIFYEIGLGVSDLREDPEYIRYYINWTRLITTGLIPMGSLIYFNFGIFRGIQVGNAF